jgi:hypothetical protein
LLLYGINQIRDNQKYAQQKPRDFNFETLDAGGRRAFALSPSEQFKVELLKQILYQRRRMICLNVSSF